MDFKKEADKLKKDGKYLLPSHLGFKTFVFFEKSNYETEAEICIAIQKGDFLIRKGVLCNAKNLKDEEVMFIIFKLYSWLERNIVKYRYSRWYIKLLLAFKRTNKLGKIKYKTLKNKTYLLI